MNKKPQELATSVRKGARRAVYDAAIKAAKGMFVYETTWLGGEYMQFVMTSDAYAKLDDLALKHKIQMPTGFWKHWAHESDEGKAWSKMTYPEQLIGILFYAEMVLTGDLDNIDGQLSL